MGNVCEPKGIFKQIRRAIESQSEPERARGSQREPERAGQRAWNKVALVHWEEDFKKKGWTQIFIMTQHCFAAKRLNTTLLYRETLKQGTFCRVCCCRPHPPTTSPPPPPTPPSPSPHPPSTLHTGHTGNGGKNQLSILVVGCGNVIGATCWSNIDARVIPIVTNDRANVTFLTVRQSTSPMNFLVFLRLGIIKK